jgi:hypothetical protein
MQRVRAASDDDGSVVRAEVQVEQDELLMNRRQRTLAAQAEQRARARPTVLGILAIVAGLVLLAAFGIVLVGVVILISPLAVPVLLLLDRMRRTRFLVQHSGESLLVVSRRRGWRDFIINNVEPALPPRARCVWLDSEAPSSEAMTFIRRLMTRRAGLRRPYLIVIPEGRPRMRFVPLHDALLPLKSTAKVSAETRRQVAAAIEAEMGRAARQSR